MCIPGAQAGQKTMSDTLEQELQMFVNHLVGTQTQVLCMEPLSLHLFLRMFLVLVLDYQFFVSFGATVTVPVNSLVVSGVNRKDIDGYKKKR